MVKEEVDSVEVGAREGAEQSKAVDAFTHFSMISCPAEGKKGAPTPFHRSWIGLTE